MGGESEWLRDLDGSGSMHPCWSDDPGAVEYVPAEVLTAAQARIAEMGGALRLISEQSKAGEIPVGYGPDVEDDPAFHRGYDAAIQCARDALTRAALEKGDE